MISLFFLYMWFWVHSVILFLGHCPSWSAVLSYLSGTGLHIPSCNYSAQTFKLLIEGKIQLKSFVFFGVISTAYFIVAAVAFFDPLRQQYTSICIITASWLSHCHSRTYRSVCAFEKDRIDQTKWKPAVQTDQLTVSIGLQSQQGYRSVILWR